MCAGSLSTPCATGTTRSRQPAQVLIQSDRTNALGFDGAGHAIAVLDTGVDYNIPELGGGGFPNAKVVGGADLGDADADPLDCQGHGTSVASVAAGPMGVAPGAKIVALKISSSEGCDTAEDSVIIAAIDWAIANQGDPRHRRHQPVLRRHLHRRSRPRLLRRGFSRSTPRLSNRPTRPESRS